MDNQFDNTLFESAQWQALLARVQIGRVPHALLLTGAVGVDKLSFARAFAAALLCREPQSETGAACGACSACQLLAAGSHGDYFDVSPEEGGRTIKIQQIRALCEELSLTAQYGGYRVGVISPADAMGENAANSLLKTLEEPRPGVILLLPASKTGALPATIRSRCQRIRLTGGSIARNCQLEQQAQKDWRAGVVRKASFIEIAEQWSKCDYEPVFMAIFSWLSTQLREKFDESHTTGATKSGNFPSAAATIELRQLFGFLDKLLATYQHAAKPGVNRRALYEKLFVEAMSRNLT